MNLKPLVSTFRASPPTTQDSEQLGHLADLPGTWVGRGFNLIALPNGQQNNQPSIFRLMLNNTVETLTFGALGGAVPNRGGQDASGKPVQDIFFKGLHYFQQVSDAKSFAGLHVEPGLWLNLPGSLARLGTVPHGDSLLAQGSGDAFLGGPQFAVADPTPFTVDASGNPQLIKDKDYLKPYSDASLLPEGIAAADVMDPNRLLAAAIVGQTITKTTVLQIDSKNQGGILNIPFVKQNADVVDVSATFWIETVQNSDGTEFMQLQYTQTVILDFAGIRWPHISIATMVKQ